VLEEREQQDDLGDRAASKRALGRPIFRVPLREDALTELPERAKTSFSAARVSFGVDAEDTKRVKAQAHQLPY